MRPPNTHLIQQHTAVHGGLDVARFQEGGDRFGAETDRLAGARRERSNQVRDGVGARGGMSRDKSKKSDESDGSDESDESDGSDDSDASEKGMTGA